MSAEEGMGALGARARSKLVAKLVGKLEAVGGRGGWGWWVAKVGKEEGG